MIKAKIKVLDCRVILDDLPRFDHNAILYVYEVDGVEVRGVHWSGKFNGPVNVLAEQLYLIATEYNAHYVTTTETQQPGAMAAIRLVFGKEWGTQHEGEYALIFLKSVFKFMPRVKPHTRIATRIKNWATWRQMHLGFFNIYHIATKRRFRIIDIHGPSGIESGDNHKAGKQWDIAVSGWPKVGKSLKRFAKYHPRAVQIVVADSNGDHKRPSWILWFELQLNARSIWRKRMPVHGTHGDRVIDGAWIYNAS